MGAPSLYVVQVAELTSSTQSITIGDVVIGRNTVNNLNCCTTFTTTERTITFPPGVFREGGSYAIGIEADAFTGGDPGSSTPPLGWAWVTPGVLITSATPATRMR